MSNENFKSLDSACHMIIPMLLAESKPGRI